MGVAATLPELSEWTLPKYISARLLQENSCLLYIKDKLLAVAAGKLQNR